MKVPTFLVLVSLLELLSSTVRATPIGVNLLLNADAESGQGSKTGDTIVAIPGWATTGNATVANYEAKSTTGSLPSFGSPGPAQRGKNFFSGGPSNAASSVTQELDLTDRAVRIDAGSLGFVLSGYFGGFENQNDAAKLTATFRDASHTVITSSIVGGVQASARGNYTGLSFRTLSSTVPPQTRYVTFRLSFDRTEGSYNDGYADNLSFSLADRTLPAFGLPLASGWLGLGEALSLTGTAGSEDVTYRWQRNSVFIPFAIAQTYSLPAVALTHAGAYRAEAKNTLGVTLSNLANIGVMDDSPRSVTVNEGATMNLTVPVAGPTGALSFRWMCNGVDMKDGRLGTQITSGTGKATLTITIFASANVAVYSCLVTLANAANPASPLLRTSGDFTVGITLKPVVTNVPVPAAEVARAFAWQLAASNNPTSFAATGLPAGLVLNTATGLVTGAPTVSGPGFRVNVTARNVAGVSAVKTFILPVSAIRSGLAATYAGLVDRQPVLNTSLGGTITTTIASSGALTGKLRLGALTYVLAGRVAVPETGNATADLLIKRTKMTSLTVSLAFAPDGSVSGSVNDTISSAAITASVNPWKPDHKPQSLAGIYNVSLDLPAELKGNVSVPQGSGYLRLTLNGARGAATVTGRTADGGVISGSSIAWSDGRLPLYVQPYATAKGSLLGLPQIIAGGTAPAYADNRVEGSIDWQKTGPISTIDRTYKTGFGPVALKPAGSKWAQPKAGTMLFGLPNQADNLRIEFSGAGIDSVAQAAQVSQPFQLLPTGAAKFKALASGNPTGVSMTLNLSTGLFSGTFKLADPKVPGPGTQLRTVTYLGLFVPHLQQGYGWFLLPGLVTNSDIPSGQVFVKTP